MPKIIEKDKLLNRYRLITWWPIAGVILIFVVFALAVYLWIKSPYLINPQFVISSIETNSYPQELLGLALIVLPIMVDAVLFVLLVFILYGFVILNREKEYVKFILKNFYGHIIKE